MARSRTFNFMKQLLSIAICLYLAFLTNPVRASEKYALLVGVSNYPGLPENRQLQGAKNDVLLMRKVLSNNGFAPAKILLLADQVNGAPAPTRDNILSALNQLKDQSNNGDFIYLHFSGHGSQQPITNHPPRAQETDGLDEIFLPADIGRWNGKTGTVKNAIVDNEFNAAILAIRKKGAFVWAVFDTCHAGTLNRGEKDTDERSREVLPTELGIPSYLIKKAASSHRGLVSSEQKETHIKKSSGSEQNLGGFAGFYAAQSDQITTETKFKVENTYATHGTFSFALAQILSAKPYLSYRELGQQILNHYAALNRFFPTPLFESTQLDAHVLDDKKGAIKNQWPLFKNTNGELIIPQGSLHQINSDSLFALVDSPEANVNTSKIHFTVKTVSALNTELKPIDAKTHQALESPFIPMGSYARLIRPGIQKRMTISYSDGQTPIAFLRSLEKLNVSKIANTELNWVKKSHNESSDFELLFNKRSMCLLVIGMPQTCKAKRAWIPISSAMDTNIQALATRASYLRKVSNLLLIAEQFPAMTELEQFDIRLLASKKNSTKKFPLDQLHWTEVNAGDKLTIEMTNNTSRSIDASLLFIDSAQNIQAIFPYQNGEVNRIEPKGKQEIILDITAETLGVEKLVAILAEAQPHSLMQDFSFLAESNPTTFHRGDSGMTDNDTLMSLFQNDVFTIQNQYPNQLQVQAKRSGETRKVTGGPLSNNTIRLFSWIVK